VISGSGSASFLCLAEGAATLPGLVGPCVAGGELGLGAFQGQPAPIPDGEDAHEKGGTDR
jgi:hypothetical protein